MLWYKPLRLSSKPPAYLVERISDLRYASDLGQVSPSAARAILDGVIEQLSDHMDNEYVDDLKAASGMMLDSPKKARSLIGIVIAYMEADKKDFDRNKRKPWKTI